MAFGFTSGALGGSRTTTTTTASHNLFPAPAPRPAPRPAPAPAPAPRPVYVPPAPVYTAPAPAVSTVRATPRTTTTAAPKPTAQQTVTNLIQRALGATAPVNNPPVGNGLPTAWGATANVRPTPMYRQMDSPTGGGDGQTVPPGISDEAFPQPYPVNADQYRYPAASLAQGGVRMTPAISPEDQARIDQAAAWRAGGVLPSLTAYGHQMYPSPSMYNADPREGQKMGGGFREYNAERLNANGGDNSHQLWNPAYGFAIPGGPEGWITTAQAGVDSDTGYPYGYVLDPQTGEWVPGPEAYDPQTGQQYTPEFFGPYGQFSQALAEPFVNVASVVLNANDYLANGGGYDSGYSSGGGGGYGGGGGGYGGGGGGGGYGGGGGGYGGGGGSGTGEIGGATSNMTGWSARYGSAGAQEVLANPAVIAKDTLAELGMEGTGLESLVGQQLTYMASQLLPFLYASTPVGQTPNASAVINMLHDLALQMISPDGAIIDVPTLLQRLLGKLDPNSIMGATFKGLTPGQQVSTAQGLLNGLSNFAPTPFLGNALRNYWSQQGTDYLSQALRQADPNKSPFNEFLSGTIYPGVQ